MRKTLIALAAVATAIAAPAAAQDASDNVTISVETGDLDLTTAAGQESLENRIENAINRACRSGGRDMDSRRAEAACRSTLSEAFAPRVELAITDAQSDRYAALEISLKA
ncbi:UrcA family protein [Aurantiacibacter sp. MUD61]|uniref:UrcA family protein n=1 Tax=Aurantiacibacter sp. MUD61 TaxID=3009083 RepID=UPI0022F0313D|nr:UrcA family protein [Aurantiacibacter sp. MUD61]